MLIIRNHSTNPYFNLAAEEVLLKDFQEDVFMLWRNKPSVIIGKNQNAIREINTLFVEDHDIPVVRRLSGGGAVFHDLGNINFTFIRKDNGKSFNNFRTFTQPILDVLNDMGVKASFSGRNDLIISGRKFSGNAQFKYKNRVLHHGTLLYNAKIHDLSKALRPKSAHIQGKSIRSVRSRVTNICDHLDPPLAIEDFISRVEAHILKATDHRFHTFSDQEVEGIYRLASCKYETWEWNFASSPSFTYSYETQGDYGQLQLTFSVDQGTMEDVRILGNFQGQGNIQDLERMLTGLPHRRSAVVEALKPVEISRYVKGMDLESFASLIY